MAKLAWAIEEQLCEQRNVRMPSGTIHVLDRTAFISQEVPRPAQDSSFWGKRGSVGRDERVVRTAIKKCNVTDSGRLPADIIAKPATIMAVMPNSFGAADMIARGRSRK